MFKSIGFLEYKKNDDNYSLILQVDQGISEFYRNLIPKYIEYNRQKYLAHITVVRIYYEKPIHLEYWNKYKNVPIPFEYTNYIFENNKYFWLNAYSNKLTKIRKELGLNIKIPSSLPQYQESFHITIANKKGI